MKLDKVVLETKALPELKIFYSAVLGLPVTVNNDLLTITAGNSQLVFKQTGTDTSPIYHYALNIPSNKLKEAMQWLQSKTPLLWLRDYNSYIADFTNWNAQSIYFLDPAGNIGELIARFDLNDISDEPFSSAQIRNISEIALVFPANEFKQQVNVLMNRYHLDYFNKQPPLEQFCAIGNDEGLLICVPEKRVWFSTDDSVAGIYPLEIYFTEGDTERLIIIGG
jgi:catechol 2,3-dioxygenase-like lactoylglutathione lyase family enzyme